MLIAHLSDLHISRKFKSENIDKTRWVIEKALESGAEHFVFTGDISDNADVKDYTIFRNILNRFGLLDTDKSTVIIGNHDIFGGVQTAMDVVNFPGRCRQTDYEKRVIDFTDELHELFEKAYFPLAEKVFPFAKQVSDTLLIGLNSIERFSGLKNPFASNGRVDEDQKNGFINICKKEEYNSLKKLVLIHHHFYKRNVEASSSQNKIWEKLESWTLKLRGKKKLMRLFNDMAIEMVLHGHSHEIKEYFRKGIRFMNAGASIDNGNENDAKLILVNTEIEKLSVHIETVNPTKLLRSRPVDFPTPIKASA